MEVHHLVGKLSTSETLLTEVQRKVPTCPGGFLVINVCNQGKNLCSSCIYIGGVSVVVVVVVVVVVAAAVVVVVVVEYLLKMIWM